MQDTNGVSLTSYTSGVELDISFKTSLPNGIYKYIFDIFLSTASQSIKVFYTAIVEERGTRLPPRTNTGTVPHTVRPNKITLLMGTFTGCMESTSTSPGVSEITVKNS